MHIGLHKTATTFLQREVFPKWEGITYIRWPNLEHFLRMDEGKTYLVSREGMSGQIWSPNVERVKSIKRLAELFPEAKILLSFRRHDKYIVSSYKEFLRQGGTLFFDEFFDIEHNKGFQQRQDLLYRPKIEAVEEYFGRRPFVFLQEEISHDLQSLLKSMEEFLTGRAPEVREIDLKHQNKGVGYFPAKLLRLLNLVTKSELNPGGRLNLDNYYTRYLKIDPTSICQKWLAFIPDRPMLDERQAARIREYYEQDWEFVCQYARRRNDL